MQLSELSPLLQIEMDNAREKYGEFHSSHEQYAAMKEEEEEWWDNIKLNNDKAGSAQYELLQVAAVALRYIIENGDSASIANVQRMRWNK